MGLACGLRLTGELHASCHNICFFVYKKHSLFLFFCYVCLCLYCFYGFTFCFIFICVTSCVLRNFSGARGFSGDFLRCGTECRKKRKQMSIQHRIQQWPSNTHPTLSFLWYIQRLAHPTFVGWVRPTSIQHHPTFHVQHFSGDFSASRRFLRCSVY